MINYQGKLMQPSGVPVPDNTYSMTFAIYSQPTGSTALWYEINPSVQVKGGLFSVLLGSVTNLPANIFDNENRWFGVSVGTDPEMAPRQQIASVGFAWKAGSADLATTVPDGAITTAKLAPGVAIPPGTIVMWSGALADIPQGWKLCDGTNGTPDLRDRFIVGAGSGYSVGATGGLAQVTLALQQMPVHTHGVTDPGHAHFAPTWNGMTGAYELPSTKYAYDYGDAAPVSTSTTGISIQNRGGDQPHENRPPYYALCFIMKLAY